VIAISMILFVISSMGLQYLSIDSDLRIFFSADNPQLQQLEAVERTYLKNENILFVIVPKNNHIFTRQVLQVIQQLTTALWQTPASSRVDSITNFQHTWAEGDELIVADLFEDIDALSQADIEQRKVIALSEPILLDRIISRSGDVSNIIVTINFVDKNPEIISAIAAHARQLRDSYSKQYPDIEFYLTGSVMFDTAFSEVGQRDLTTLVPLMLLVMVVAIGLIFRTVIATLITLTIIIMATATAMGLAGWLGISINPASASAPIIVLTLAVADSVHILFIMYRQMYAGKSRRDAIIESIEFNFQAVFLTSLTTVVGFLTMNFSDAPPFHDLGNIVAIGITAAFFYSVFFLPALVSLLPLSLKVKPYPRQFSIMAAIARLVIQHKTPILLGSLFLVAGLGISALQNRLNDNWINYFTANVPVRVATDILEQRISGADFLEYHIRSGKPQGINDPEFLAYLDRFVQWLRAHPQVVQVTSITDVMKKLNRVMHDEDQAWYRLPEQHELAAQYLLLYEMSLPYGLDLNHIINVDKSATRVIMTTKNLGTRALSDLDLEAQAWLNENAPASMASQGTGISIVFAYLSGRNIINMLTAAFGALLAISAILVIAFRRLDIGLISLLPNIIPALLAFGLWGLLVGEIGLGLSVVVSMTLGIVVDDTVHFITKYLRAREQLDMSREQGIQHAFTSVGPAMWTTTIALVAGFLVLMLSDYKMSADMGLLSAITISIALVMDFLLLPAVLLISDRD
ncbi:MAG: MMPL family transporter, partial [Gammaproteobacteria bacterium]|nr:MMPL family transporter [Gammaproteobacteria bacterium]